MQPAAPTNLDDPALYINRELSWLEFNRRVLEEAQDPTVPLLERLKFLAIFSSNLDEFFMVRVGGCSRRCRPASRRLRRRPHAAARCNSRRSRQTVRELVAEQYRCLTRRSAAGPRNAKASSFAAPKDLTDADRKHLRDLFRREIFPVLTPLAIDPAHPFPHLLNKSLNLAVLAAAARRCRTRSSPSCRCRACCRASCRCPARHREIANRAC